MIKFILKGWGIIIGATGAIWLLTELGRWVSDKPVFLTAAMVVIVTMLLGICYYQRLLE